MPTLHEERKTTNQCKPLNRSKEEIAGVDKHIARQRDKWLRGEDARAQCKPHRGDDGLPDIHTKDTNIQSRGKLLLVAADFNA